MEFGLTVGDSLERIGAADPRYDFLELSIGDSFLSPTTIDVDRLADRLDGRELYVHLPFDQPVVTHVPEVNDAIVEYQSRLLSWAGEVGARKAVLHATTADRDDVDLRDRFATQLEAILAAGERAGVEVVVENVGHQHRGVQLSVLGTAAGEADAPLCFDVGHAYMEADNDGIARFLRSHGDRVSHLHVHDARRRGDTHLPVGAGEIDFGLLTEHLPTFDGSVAVEVFTEDAALLWDSIDRVRRQFDPGDQS
ncbi:MAG: sugar phosphate isomerase/epimerase [Haloferacaceae archaeon]